jgi:predicted O-methyltransferase YrrM
MSVPQPSPAKHPGQIVPVNRYASAPAWRAVDAYFSEALVAEDAALVSARESGARTTMPNAEVAANQGAFLALLTQIAGARRVLEFGTLAGYSTVWFARAVGEGGHVVTLELEDRNAAIARENLDRAGVGGRVDLMVGPAVESAQTLIDDQAEPFDLVFIDADKPSNPVYLAAALRLTRPGAVIVIDNVVRDGAVTDARSDDARVQGVRAVVDAIVAHPELDATALQTVGEKGWDGLIIARRR